MLFLDRHDLRDLSRWLRTRPSEWTPLLLPLALCLMVWWNPLTWFDGWDTKPPMVRTPRVPAGRPL